MFLKGFICYIDWLLCSYSKLSHNHCLHVKYYFTQLIMEYFEDVKANIP